MTVEHWAYPTQLAERPGVGAPDTLWALGNASILRHPMLALFCSVRCPGNIILKTYDLVCALRNAQALVIGGFHSPMEKECLRLLLRGEQPVIVCPARGIQRMRVPAAWRGPIEEGRLLVLSPFEEKRRRPTVALSEKRNRFVAALADQVFIPYASPRGKTERLAREILGWGRPVLTFQGDRNDNLVQLGAIPLGLEQILDRLTERQHG